MGRDDLCKEKTNVDHNISCVKKLNWIETINIPISLTQDKEIIQFKTTWIGLLTFVSINLSHSSSMGIPVGKPSVPGSIVVLTTMARYLILVS